MAKLSDEVLELDIVINGNKAQAQLGKLQTEQRNLRKANEDLRKEKAKLIKQGKTETEAYKRVTRAIRENNTAIKRNSEEQTALRSQIGITALTTRQLVQEQKRLKAIMGSYAPETAEWKGYNSELLKVNKRLGQVRGRMRGVAGVIGKMKAQFSGFFATMTAGFSVVAILQGINKLVSSNADLSDVQADVAKTTGLSKTEIDQLTTSLKRFDTRTPVKGLLELATEAGRLGKETVEDVEEFVKTADKIRVALGDDLQGDVNENVTLIGKLATQYKVGKKEGASFGQSMEKVGSAINEVSASGSNQAGFLVDYLKRMVGVSAQTNISASDQLGYAAAFDESGQSVEVAATTMSKVIIDMYASSAEYAEIAGVSTQEFSDLLSKDANEALLLFLKGLQGNGEGLEVMTKKMDELGLEGSRSVATLTAIAANLDNVRNKQLIASRATAEGTSLTNEFNKKNENLAATLDKIGNAIQNRFTGSGLQRFFNNVATAVLQLVEASETATEAYETQGRKVVELEKNLRPLIEEYDDLTSKTELSKEEQDRMKDVMGQIAVIAPTAITAFDEYGNAIAISSDKAKDFIQTQKALLQFRNQEAIKEETELLEDYKDKIQAVQSALSNRNEQGDVVRTVTTFSKTDQVTISEEKLSGREIAKLQQQLQEYQNKRIGIEASLNELSGDFLEQQAEREKEKTRITLAELQKRASALGIEFDDSTSQEELTTLIAQEERKLAIKEAARLKDAELADKALKEAERRQKKVVEDFIKNNEDLQAFIESQRAEKEANALSGIDRELALLDIRHAKEKEKYLLSEEERKLLSVQQIEQRESLLKQIEESQLQERNDRKVQYQEELNLRLQELEEENYLEEEALRLEREALAAETEEEKALILLERAQLLAQQELDIFQWKELEKLRISGASEEEIAALQKKHAIQQQKLGVDFAKQEQALKKDQVKWTEMTEQQKLNAVTGALSMAADAFNEGSAAWKAAKIAEVTITTYQSAVNAFNALSGIPIVGPALGAVAAGLAVASGIKQVSNIASTPIQKINRPKKGKVTGRESGFYPSIDVTRSQDGRRFNAVNGGRTTTQIVDRPTYFSDDYVAGEAGPEMIIDAPTFRRLDPTVVDHIHSVHRNVTGYQSGLFPQSNQTTTAPNTEEELEQRQQLSEERQMLLTTMMSIQNRLENPIAPVLPIGYEEAAKIQQLNDEQRESEQNAIL